MSTLTRLVLRALAVVVTCSCSVVSAQDDPAVAPANPESAESSEDKSLTNLRERIAQLAPRISEAEADEAGRKLLTERLAQATADLDLAEPLKRRNAELKERLQGLAGRVESLKAAPKFDPLPSLRGTATPELENVAATLSLSITAAQQKLGTLQQSLEDSADRRRSLQQQTIDLEQSVEGATASIRQLPADAAGVSESIERIAAEALRLRTAEQRAMAQTSLAELDAELTLNLPTLRVAHQQKLLTVLQRQQQDLRAELESRRQQESRDQLDKARRDEVDLATISNAAVRALGERHVKLAAENDALTQTRIPHWQGVLQRREAALNRLRTEGRKIQDRVQRFGTDATAGRELMHFRTALPDLAELRDEIATVDSLMSDLRLQQIEIVDDQTTIDDLTNAARPPTAEEEQILGNVSIVLGLLENNRRQLFSSLSELHGKDRETREFIEEWSAFVSEHALWLRSHEPLSKEDLVTIIPTSRHIGDSLLESLNRRRSTIGSTVWLLLVPAAIALVVLIAVQERARRGLVKYGVEAESKTCVSIRPTLRALLLSFGMAAEWPLLMMIVGSLLQIGAIRGDSLAGVGAAISQLGGIALWLNLFRQILRSDGLAARHLHWNAVIRDRLRQWLHTVMLVIALPVFLYLVARNVEHQSDVLYRILLLVFLVCSSALNWLLVGGRRNAFVNTIVSRSPLLQRTRLLWVAIIIGHPLALAACSAAGFHHTATSLWDRLGWTIVAASLVILTWSLVVRWLQVNHRATRLALARERAQQRDQLAQSVPGGAPPVETVVAETTTNRETLLELDAQANRLVRNAAILVMIGCAWAIWFDVLPALKVLDKQGIWDVEEQVAVTEFNEAGEEDDACRTEIRPVTIVSLLLAFFTVIVTSTGVRQLPGLVEVILLRQMKTDAGVRYAITTVVRYLVLIAGGAIVCHLLGLRWSQVQWLAAGLSVGLGFGLQEVFANFVSGIIILLERPIRIGDVVTIDGVSGTVSRIQIRATSITDWDRREYIVPNKELVTGKLLNWTLSDATNRVVINVGIAYGSDTDRAREIMLRVANEHSNVMKDPAPIATFESFGDSALQLILRAYLPDMNNRLSTITELHTRIHGAFADAGIKIPFPQREIRTVS